MNYDDVMLLFRQGIVEDFADLLAKSFFAEKERREKAQTEASEEPKPHEFKRGDKVRYIGRHSSISGWSGTVSEASPSQVRGVWDSGPGFILRSADLEPLPPSEDPKLTQPEQPKPTHRFKVGDVVCYHDDDSGAEYKITALGDAPETYYAVDKDGVQQKSVYCFESWSWYTLRHEPPSEPAPQWQAGDVVLSSNGYAYTLYEKNDNDTHAWWGSFCGQKGRYGFDTALESSFVKLLHRPSDSAEAKS